MIVTSEMGEKDNLVKRGFTFRVLDANTGWPVYVQEFSGESGVTLDVDDVRSLESALADWAEG